MKAGLFWVQAARCTGPVIVVERVEEGSGCVLEAGLDGLYTCPADFRRMLERGMGITSAYIQLKKTAFILRA